MVSLELLIDSNCTQLYVINPITNGSLGQNADAVLLARTVSFLREHRLVAGELSGFSERMADSTLFSKHFKVCPFSLTFSFSIFSSGYIINYILCG